MHDSLVLKCPKCGHPQELAATIVNQERTRLEREFEPRMKAALEEKLTSERSRLAVEAEEHYANQLKSALGQIEQADARLRDLALEKRDLETRMRLSVAEEVRAATALQEQQNSLLQAELAARDERLALAEAEQRRFRQERTALELERLALHERITEERDQAVRESEARLHLEREAALRAKQHEIELLKLDGQERDRATELRIRQTRGEISAQLRTELDTQHRTTLQAKELELDRLKRQIQDLQSSRDTTTKGEAQEIVLEDLLRRHFPRDIITPVATGQAGGDIVHRVFLGNQECGTILWESKNTRTWGKDWTSKNREDQKRVQAQVGVIVSVTLPPGVESFADIDSIWVTGVAFVEPLARILRQQVIEIARVRASLADQDTKMGQAYAYLTGPEFRQYVGGILDAYRQMRADLDAERRSIKRLWSKREKQLTNAIVCTSSLWGALEAIAGAQLPTLSALSLPDSEDAASTKALSAAK